MFVYLWGQNQIIMSVLSVKDFAVLAGISYDTAKKNCQRGNILKGTDGKIDTDNPVNKLYLSSNPSAKAKIKEPVPENTVKESVSKEPKKRVASKEEKEATSLRLRKVNAEVSLAERNAELKQIELERKAGNLMPLDMVEKILVINIQAIFKNVESENENIAGILVDKLGGNRDDLAEVNQMMREVLSKAIAKSQKDAAKEIETLILDVSESRGVGQRN